MAAAKLKKVNSNQNTAKESLLEQHSISNSLSKHNKKELENISLLLKWHQSFPVSIYEKHRNLAIHELQGNRNPFIDFPEIAECIVTN